MTLLGSMTAGAAAPAPPSSVEPDEARYPLRQRYRSFAPMDYAVTAGVLATFATLELSLPGPASAPWTGPIPIIDKPLRNAFVLSTRRGRERADRLSDYFWYSSVAYPVAASVAVPLFRYQDGWSSLQLSLMNLQAFAVSTLLVRLHHKLIGRLRPNSIGCAEDAEYDSQCEGTAQYVSFYAGHTTIAMTGAGLSCAHHVYGKLYGGPADGVACAAAVAAGGAVAVFRMQADRHWFSDNVVGMATGFGIGYGLPMLLYYRPFSRRAEAPRTDPPLTSYRAEWTVMPWLSESEARAVIVGTF